MNVTIRDNEALQALGPSEIAAYLRSLGWRFDRHFGSNGTVWRHGVPGGKEFELLLPNRQDLDDYARRVSEALQTLELVEARSQLDILQDINDSYADIVRLRLEGASLDDGSVPLDAALRTVQYAREMMLAAACSVVQPKAVYRTRKPDQANEYLRSVRLGQTGRGSFVLAIRSMVPPRLTTPSPDASEEPFQRRVTMKLADALQAAAVAVKEANITGTISPFQSAIERGVSANLCEAIAGMTEEGVAQAVSVSMNWSSARPLPSALNVSSFRFTADSAPLFQEVARVFRDQEPYGAFELRGAVVKLERPENAVSGDIIVSGTVEGVLRKVMLHLLADDYQKAAEAHLAGQTIYVEGELIREGRSYRLLNPRNLLVPADTE